MNYAKIKPVDIANGPGCRVSLFVSGCTIRCPGCFNKDAQDFNCGKPFTFDAIDEIIELLKPDYISGLSILGGEPFDQKRVFLTIPLEQVKALYPEKSVWMYTGYKFEDIKSDILTQFIDVLVDGPFVEAEKDPGLAFRGSRNQRIIDVKASLEAKRVVLMEEYMKDRRVW